MATLVTGEIELPANTDSFSGATVYVSLESVGMMDMPSESVAQSTQRNVSYSGSVLSFSVDGSLGDAIGPFNLRAHVSMHGSDDVQKGDYLTKRTYTVLKENNPEHVSVKVDKV
jgi:hypothetical protein